MWTVPYGCCESARLPNDQLAELLHQGFTSRQHENLITGELEIQEGLDFLLAELLRR